MSYNFHPFLINNAFGDPGLFIQFMNKNKAFLFDIGDVSGLSTHKILSVTHIFVTHTHIDHFFGFDRLLRIFLGRKKIVRLYGPPGFFLNIEGKLAGYHWNMTTNYNHSLTLHVTEVYEDHTLRQIYRSNNKFKRGQQVRSNTKKDIVISQGKLKIRATTLDHGTPCIGLSLQEKPHVKILHNKIKSMGLLPGHWITYLKECLYNSLNKKILLQVPNNRSQLIKLSLGYLEKKITQISPGQKITYITDVNYSNTNQKSMVSLAYKSSHLFIEASFTTEHEYIAAVKHHLTAQQAGKIARTSESLKYTLFHHSPRYINCPDNLKSEAESAFKKKV